MSQARIIPPLALPGTLALIWFVPQSLLLVLLLPLFWFAVYRPFDRHDLLVFLVAGLFITIQNYLVLRTGAFVFTQQDFLLMPYYEPLLWGFYFLSLKRFFAHQEQVRRLEWRAIAGLVLISLAFGLFSGTIWHSAAVFAATGFLLVLFHTGGDLSHGLYALAMGFVVELFGVSTGQWHYPNPDILGIPYWFAPMWISVGILGRRLLFPLVRFIDQRLPVQGSQRQ
ncbi:MAG TPA: hypothetical protein ENN39_09035 [Desulfonatronum sp.]|nr:hypothetical protein [Desulfonatronum sp.]